MCVGENLARASTLILLTSMIQSFSFTIDPNTPLKSTEGVPGFTLAAPYFRVIATPRSWDYELLGIMLLTPCNLIDNFLIKLINFI